MLFCTWDLLVRQRTQSINALRGHLAAFGVVAPQNFTRTEGPARGDRLVQAVADETMPLPLPVTVRELARFLLGQIAELGEKINALGKDIRRRAPPDEQIARLMTIPGVGAICATAVQAFCPSSSFLAWPRSGVAAIPLGKPGPRGSARRRNGIQPVARRGSEKHRRWGSATCAAF
jgi:transposase